MANREYDNTGRGALFHNTRRHNENSPDFRGRINIDGVEYWLSGWSNESNSGKKYLSLVLGDEIPPQEAEEAPPKPRGRSGRSAGAPSKPRGSAGAARSRRAPPPDDVPEDDDIPF